MICVGSAALLDPRNLSCINVHGKTVNVLAVILESCMIMNVYAHHSGMEELRLILNEGKQRVGQALLHCGRLRRGHWRRLGRLQLGSIRTPLLETDWWQRPVDDQESAMATNAVRVGCKVTSTWVGDEVRKNDACTHVARERKVP